MLNIGNNNVNAQDYKKLRILSSTMIQLFQVVLFMILNTKNINNKLHTTG